eukprot:TRINITY_DN15462_c0_g3_i2.p1 TRINITY_DN15462_c0_g3~~TRINITY_DN15462_c0_g3_i2.p1  ORF type:complete len:358 (-),score=64.22 TRINITY_DN15462_c0_g3_i2:11-1084(-)
MENHEPMKVDMRTTIGNLANGDHWKLLDNDITFDVAVSADGGFYNSVASAKSPLGMARIAPAVLEALPWRTLREVFTFLANRSSSGDTGDSRRRRIPASLKKERFPNFNDVFEDGAIPLAVILAREKYKWYVNGQANQKLQEKVFNGPLHKLTVRLKRIMNKDPISSNMWLSAGDTVSNLHYDPSENWMCQLAGKKAVTLYAPKDSSKMYPVIFNEDGMDIDYQFFLRKDGRMKTFLMPKQYRDSKVYAAAKEGGNNSKRFPEFEKAEPMQCSIAPGECLWIPQIWWHNIKSEPSEVNLGINYWFGMPAHSRGEFDAEEAMKNLHKELKKSMAYLKQTGRAQSGGEKSPRQDGADEL